MEPLGALCRRSVIEAFRNDIALTTLLQRIVTNLVRGIDRFFKIASFQNALLVCVISPDTSKTIGLDFSTRTDIWLA